jgi:hypothetical protein
MWRKNRRTQVVLFAAAAVVISRLALRAADAPGSEQKTKSNSEPVLYLCRADSNSTEMVAADANIIPEAILRKSTDGNSPGPEGLNLVVATHGWFEPTPWPRELVLAMKSRVNSSEWFLGWFDWRSRSKVINPADAAKFARDIAGPLLGEQIAEISTEWRHVHLIGHSCGAWLINEAAKVIASRTDASIHLTFLDAYIPLFWKKDTLGDFGSDPNTPYWADHYIIHDITLTATGPRLKNAHNVDITAADADIPDHDFVRHWYRATVIGGYAQGDQYQGRELFNAAAKIEYGFARSLEAGEENFKASAGLKHGNKPVKIKKPGWSLKSFLKKLFKADD